jgi:hypothetical protein
VVAKVSLAPLDIERVRRERDLREQSVRPSKANSNRVGAGPPRAREIGVYRELQIAGPDGKWFTIDPGRSWLLDIQSPFAEQVRLHFTNFHLPHGAKLFVGSPETNTAARYFEGNGPFGTGEFWSPFVNGDSIRLELSDAEGSLEQFAELPFQITGLGHVYEPDLGGFGTSAQCELDYMCYPDYATAGKPVTKIQFSDSQYVYVCSAILLNNLSGDFSPLLLTAHHCIDSEALAQSVEVLWNLQSWACGSTSYGYGPVAHYATLLATTWDTTDASLLQILGSVSPASTWAAWSTVDPDVGSNVVGIHHPHADPKKISFGKTTPGSDPNRHSVMWNNGLMESGSSGSPLFNAANQVVGQLYGGQSSCSVSGPDVYGKLRLSQPQFTGPIGWNYLEKGIPDDAYAPNATRGAAALLTVPGTYSLVAKIGVDDWFHIMVAPGQTVMVPISYDIFGAHLTMEMYVGDSPSPFQTVLWTANSTPPYKNTNAGPVDLYLHISMNQDSGVRVGYRLVPEVPALPSVTTIATLIPWTWFGEAYLNGQYDSAGWAANTWFEWGTDPSLSSFQTATALQIGGGSLRADIKNLSPSTTYYYRAVASTAGGEARGSILSFTTAAFTVPSRPSPADGESTSYFPRQFSVEAGGTTFDFYLGTDPHPPLFKNGTIAEYFATNVGTNVPDGTLAASTHYYWRIVTHYQETSASSPVYQFTTPPLATATASALAFTPVLAGMSSSLVIDVAPVGYGNLSFSMNGAAFSFEILGSAAPCSYSLCKIRVTFHPTAAGPYNGSLIVTSTAAQGSTAIPLTGTGFDMTLSRPTRPGRDATVPNNFSLRVVFSRPAARTPRFTCTAEGPYLCTVKAVHGSGRFLRLAILVAPEDRKESQFDNETVPVRLRRDGEDFVEFRVDLIGSSRHTDHAQ